MTDPGDGTWWQGGVLYQIYPRSFADSDGDGNGDIVGIIDHLDHLEWLGVDGIWISPVTVSPNADWGYDVADFFAVQPDFGSIADVDRLIDEANRRNIRVLFDLVPNHTSDQHPWFKDACSSMEAVHRGWYVWADPKPDGTEPNNWVSSFGGPAWTLAEGTGQYYLHNHLDEQPDLNWWSDEVRDAFDGVMRFWLDRGIAGFRIDVCNVIIKDALLRDNPPATEEDDFEAQLFGQQSVYNANRPEVHDVIRRWRRLADSYDEPRILVGETPVKLRELGAYYGDGTNELHLAFNFPFISAPFEVAALRSVVEETESTLPPGAWPAWVGSNHDMQRFTTRWADDDPQLARVAIMILLTLRGTPVLYQGDEIGLGDVPVPHEAMRDPLGVRYWPAYAGRDAMRTPMQWRDGPGGGFTPDGVEPWLPLGDTRACNVADQRVDPDSMLHLVRDLIRLRRLTQDLRSGSYAALEVGADTWAWRRGKEHLVVVHLGALPTVLAGVTGEIRIATDRTRDGQRPSGDLLVAPREGVVVKLG